MAIPLLVVVVESVLFGLFVEEWPTILFGLVLGMFVLC